MTVDRKELKDTVRRILPEVKELRHRLHRIPENKFHETRTSREIRSFISRDGVKFLGPYLETDVVALLPGGRGNGKNVTLRADMDALPVKDESGKEWSSRNEGYHHACGHDGHMAMLSGALLSLKHLSHRFKGSVRFVFQPAEEEGLGGKQLVEKGVLRDKPEADVVFGLHGWPGLPLGTIHSRPGVLMAAADQFEIAVTGPGGHGAMPDKTVDPVVSAARIVCALQTVISRKLPPQQAGLITVGSIHGGTTKNAIPDRVLLEGTVRYLHMESKEILRRCMEQVIEGTCSADGTDYEFSYFDGYIPLENDPAMVDFGARVARQYLGKDSFSPVAVPTMGAEDFAYYLKEKPGAFFWLGLGEKSPGLHSPTFDFNDDALENGITCLCGLALEALDS